MFSLYILMKATLVDISWLLIYQRCQGERVVLIFLNFLYIYSLDFSINESHFVKTMAAIHNRIEKFPFHIDQWFWIAPKNSCYLLVLAGQRSSSSLRFSQVWWHCQGMAFLESWKCISANDCSISITCCTVAGSGFG